MGGILVTICLYFFISAVNMMGAGLGLAAENEQAKDKINSLFKLVEDPYTGLFVGLLVTSIVQSSTFTTSTTVSLVAAGTLNLNGAIPIIMGANIGTSVTAIVVSLFHIRRREEFRLSFSAAIMHDFFNVLTVLILFPLELTLGILSRPVDWIAKELARTHVFAGSGAASPSFFKVFFGYIGQFAAWITRDVMHLDVRVAGAIVSILSLFVLFGALTFIIKVLRGVMMGRISGAFNKTLFRNPPVAFVFGVILTASIHSSSVTTSLIIPLVAAGVLQHIQVFPYLMGANIGTTCTAMLAAIGTGSAAAIACACAHTMFNAYGTIIFWPLQTIPISLAKWFATKASQNRILVLIFVLGLFYILPISFLIIKKYLGS